MVIKITKKTKSVEFDVWTTLPILYYSADCAMLISLENETTNKKGQKLFVFFFIILCVIRPVRSGLDRPCGACLNHTYELTESIQEPAVSQIKGENPMSK